MLMGPKGSPPVFVSVTDACAVLPTLTWPKSIAVVEIAMSVSTAPAGGTKIPNIMTTMPIVASGLPPRLKIERRPRRGLEVRFFDVDGTASPLFAVLPPGFSMAEPLPCRNSFPDGCQMKEPS